MKTFLCGILSLLTLYFIFGKASDCPINFPKDSIMSEEVREEACARIKRWLFRVDQTDPVKLTPAQMEFAEGLAEDKKRCKTKSIRRDYRTLTDEEWRRFHRAMNTLKRTMVDDLSQYDILATLHLPSNAPAAHGGPAFLPWHREFLLRFERALRNIDCRISLPYWAHVLDAELPSPEHSVTWSNHFFGGRHGNVTSGPFANWKVRVGLEVLVNITGQSVQGSYLPDAIIRYGSTDYSVSMCNFDCVVMLMRQNFLRDISLNAATEIAIEASLHNVVHQWVGGLMSEIETAANDPVFFLHHAFMDCLWEFFRQKQKSNGIDVISDYPTDNAAVGNNSRHGPLFTMRPFSGKLNIDGLTDKYTKSYYSCTAMPGCGPGELTCNSKYLFCDAMSGLCLPKITEGGNCTGFMGHDDVCFQSICVSEDEPWTARCVKI